MTEEAVKRSCLYGFDAFFYFNNNFDAYTLFYASHRFCLFFTNVNGSLFY